VEFGEGFVIQAHTSQHGQVAAVKKNEKDVSAETSPAALRPATLRVGQLTCTTGRRRETCYYMMSAEALPAWDDVDCASEVDLPVQEFGLRHRNRNYCGIDTF
jgi:hypothetical protein